MAASSSSSNDSNLFGALSYLIMPISSVATLLMKPEDKYVKFHSWQGIVLGVALFVIGMVLNLVSAMVGATVPIVGFLVGLLVGRVWLLVEVLVWLYCMWNAYSGEKFKLPVLGDFAEKQANQ